MVILPENSTNKQGELCLGKRLTQGGMDHPDGCRRGEGRWVSTACGASGNEDVHFSGGCAESKSGFFNPKTDFTLFNGIEKNKTKTKDHESNAMHTL